MPFDLKSGVEFCVRDDDGHLRGRSTLRRGGLIWREGSTRAGNGKQVRWSKFNEWINATGR